MTRVVPITTDRLRSATDLDGGASRVRELTAVREIAHAFLTARRPEQVYQLALERISPLVWASLACVYLVSDAADTMTLAAAHNWPERYAGFLRDMRIRIGSGPSGEAAAERRVIEVPDVYANRQLLDWHEIARELGFRALIAVPLESPDRVLGTLTFYFNGPGAISEDTRRLARLVADQMAATAEKSRLIADLQTSNGALSQSKAALEQQYASLVEARRVKDEFLSNISHELRTPLTAVIGYLALLEDGAAGPLSVEQLQTLGEVRNASDRLLRLIGDLLDFTALSSGLTSVAVSEFDARAPLRDAISRLGALPPGIELHVEEPEKEIRVAGDLRKTTKVLGALLDNAFKFTEAGSVRVELRQEGDKVVYLVHDTGIGIAPDALELVFEEFRQADGTLTRRYGGSGLGLALARRLARLLGGDILLTSTLGAGSTFRVQLPLIAPVQGAPSTAEAASTRAETS